MIRSSHTPPPKWNKDLSYIMRFTALSAIHCRRKSNTNWSLSSTLSNKWKTTFPPTKSSSLNSKVKSPTSKSKSSTSWTFWNKKLLSNLSKLISKNSPLLKNKPNKESKKTSTKILSSFIIKSIRKMHRPSKPSKNKTKRWKRMSRPSKNKNFTISLNFKITSTRFLPKETPQLKSSTFRCQLLPKSKKQSSPAQQYLPTN